MFFSGGPVHHKLYLSLFILISSTALLRTCALVTRLFPTPPTRGLFLFLLPTNQMKLIEIKMNQSNKLFLFFVFIFLFFIFIFISIYLLFLFFVAFIYFSFHFHF